MSRSAGTELRVEPAIIFRVHDAKAYSLGSEVAATTANMFNVTWLHCIFERQKLGRRCQDLPCAQLKWPSAMKLKSQSSASQLPNFGAVQDAVVRQVDIGERYSKIQGTEQHLIL